MYVVLPQTLSRIALLQTSTNSFTPHKRTLGLFKNDGKASDILFSKVGCILWKRFISSLNPVSFLYAKVQLLGGIFFVSSISTVPNLYFLNPKAPKSLNMPSAYVTGGASGIGRAVAQMLVKHKYAMNGLIIGTRS